jgi:hypothetical protein
MARTSLDHRAVNQAGVTLPIPPGGFAKRMQCCNKADYHIDYEICCDFNNSRPAPFLWSVQD